MVYPLGIHNPEKYDPLELAHFFRTDFFFFLGIHFSCDAKRVLLKRFPVNLFNVFVFQILFGHEYRFELFLKPVHVPLFGIFRSDRMHGYGIVYYLLYHREYIFLKVLALKHLPALGVDYLPLPVHYIVVLKYVLPYREVPSLNLLLRSFYGLRKNRSLYGIVVAHSKLVHDSLYPVASEEPHEIVLKRYEKL